MPVYVDSERSSLRQPAEALHGLGVKPPSSVRKTSSGCISIGLINNMPQGGFHGNRAPVHLASRRSVGRISRSVCRSTPCLTSRSGQPGDNNTGSSYSSIDKLWETDLDGLIVTGKEPVTANLEG